jgi:uncharacterized protein YggE
MHYRLFFICVMTLIGSTTATHADIDRAVRPISELTVTGQATLQKPADEATLHFTVVNEATTANEALEANSQQMRQVIAILEDAGLSAKEYKTGRFNVRSLYTEHPSHIKEGWQPKVRGYEVNNELTITTQQIDKLGTWIDLAIQKGVNNVSDISFSLHDLRTYRHEAIRAATANAAADAHTLASSANVHLGRVLSIALDQASHRPITYQPMMAKAFHAYSEAAPPIAAGDVDVQASVTIVYELIP